MKSNNYQQRLSCYFGLGLILLLFVGTESFAQFRTIERAETMKKPVLYNGKAASSQGHYDGVIRIKMRPEATAQLDRMLLERASAKGEVIARSSDSHVVTGMTQLDAVHQGCEAKVMKRVFRPAGKFEAKHRKHGLHLWYEVQYDDPRAIEQILRDYRGVAEVAIAEKVHEKAHVGYEVSGVYEAEEVLTDPPNDPFFDLNQYSFNNTGQNIQGQVGTVGADVSMFEAWAIETGSSDIVVAVTDGGIQVDHEDLVGNMWVNVDEIPGNGIDDDNNGYVDDINGYGFGDDTGSIPADIHGSHVGGTVAAETNNAIGVAGIAGGEGTDDGVRLMSLAAFGETGTMGFEDTYTYGADNGAVISQNSWGYTVAGVFDQVVLDGIDYFIAEAGTDALGNPFGPMQGGIVIFAAGNDNADGQWYPGFYDPVLAVGGTDNQDGRYDFSNFGTWVDIAAPAVDIASTGDGGGYFFLTGTSMACPHVSGAAALLLSNLSRNGGNITPADLRAALVDNTDNIDATIPGFVGLLGSGRLNVEASLNALNVGPCTVNVPAGLASTNITDSSADISWDAQASATSYDYRFREVGAATWTTVNTSGTSASLSGLSPLTDYEFQVSAICPDETSAFSASSNFTTLDVPPPCDVEVPTGLTSSNITDTSADISWDAQAEATSYDYRYRATGSTTWTTVNTASTSANLSGLSANTEYEFQVSAICPDETSAFSASATFTTLDVTLACTDLPVLSVSNITEDGATVSWLPHSGVDDYQYRYNLATGGSTINGTTTSTSVVLSGLLANTEYQFRMRANCTGGGNSGVASIFFTTGDVGGGTCDIPDGLSASNVTESSATINWNSVGSADSYDYRYRPVTATTWTTGNTTATSADLSGLLADTVYEYQVQSVCAAEVSGYSPSSEFSTTSGGGGEVPCSDAPSNVTASNIGASTATISWDAVIPGELNFHQYRYRETGTTSWTTGTATTNSVDLSGLLANTDYTFAIRNNCTVGGNSPVVTITFTTGSSVSSSAQGRGIGLDQNIQYYPNPVREVLNVRVSDAAPVKVRVYDLNGALMKEVMVSPDAEGVDVRSLQPGVYIMEMLTDKKIQVKRFNKE